MKIVVLDGHTANPGDLSWEPLLALGDCVIHERTPPGLAMDRARGAAALLTNKVALDAAMIGALPKLRYVGVLATGYNVVDTAAARARGIPVCNVPEYSTASVAQAALALLLELTNGVGEHARSVRAGDWTRAEDFCYWRRPLVELRGLTLGIIGYGRIGRAFAGVALALGMKVIVCRRQPAARVDGGARLVDLDTLVRESDVVSLHCPLTEENRGFVNAAFLARLKPSAYLINTARGGLVNERDLAEALNAGRLAGAGLDVLGAEPPPADHPLLRARNCVVTPHQAWATRAARERLIQQAADNLRAFLDGRPINVVN